MKVKPAEGILWSKLSDSEREELLLSDKESNDPMNLIPHSEIEKKHKKWL
jgi:hypothetical protein